MTPHRPCVVGFGELVWDVLPHATLPGGAPANFVFHTQQLGAEGILVSATGRDRAGDDLRRWLDAMHLSTAAVQTNDRPTGSVAVELNAAGQPHYVILEDAAWDAIEWNRSLEMLARRADCVYVGSLAQRSRCSRETIRRFLAECRPDCLRVFDVNLRAPHDDLHVVEQTLDLVDVAKFNDEEWPSIAARLNLSQEWRVGMRELLDRKNLSVVALTRGARGSVVMDRNQCCELPPNPTPVVDTIGAGDAFTAALTMGLLFGHPLRDAQANAAAIAEYVCTQSGATPMLPEELSAPFNITHTTTRLTRLRAGRPTGAVDASDADAIARDAPSTQPSLIN